MAYPLAGVTVIDFTEYVAGPYGTMMLADMGADVIKVEPWDGDHWRRQHPIARHDSRYFIGVNRGKKSIAVRKETPEGRALVYDLVRNADVVMMNYRPGTAAGYGLDYDALAAIKPDIIYCNITAFGSDGPFRDKPGFDLLIQAMTGIMDFERKIDRGVPIGVTAFAPADLSSGMFAAFAVVSALYRRGQTGEGQKIDLSLFASALAIQYRPTLSLEDPDAGNRATLLAAVHAGRESGLSYEDTLKFRAGLGLERASALYYRVYQTQDSMVAVACLNNRQRRALRDALQVDDPSIDGVVFEAVPGWTKDDLERMMQAFESAMATRTTAEWLALLELVDVPCVPVLLTEEVFDHPAVNGAGIIPELVHPTVGRIRQPRTPITMNNAETGRQTPAPGLSEDARSILSAIGYGEESIAALESAGIVRTNVYDD